MRSRSVKKSRVLTVAGAEQDNRMEVVTMSRDLSLYEAMGGTYRSVDGILYPNIDVDVMHSGMDSAITTYDIGKYGHLWIS